MYADWSGHLHRALPELAVHDLAREFDDIRRRLTVAARTARRTGLPWSVIGGAAGISGERAERRWGVDSLGAAIGPPPGSAARHDIRPIQPPTMANE